MTTTAPPKKAPAPAKRVARPGHWSPGRVLERYGVVIAWIVVAAFFSILMPTTFPTFATATVIFGTQTVILIAALGLVCSLAVGEYDLSVGSVVGLGASLFAVLTGLAHWSTWPALVVTILVCAAVGAVNAIISVAVGVPSIIVTLGIGTFIAGITLAITGSSVVTGVPADFVSLMTTPVLGIPLPFYFGVLVTLVIWFVLQQTPLGRRMIFVEQNREVARLAGLRVGAIRAGGLIATSVLAGVAGVILAGTNGAADPQSGGSYLLPAFAAAFLGSTCIIPGRFNAIGTFVAVYFLVTGITGLQYEGFAGWPEQVFYGASLVVAVTLSYLAGRRTARRRSRSE
ncbi:ABC transporter permease [Microbacterium sp.]|uniref:ABC transporter permease n=1 Tax=Microbacterium sp. TaxID=51671 RepID=UPI003A8D24EE